MGLNLDSLKNLWTTATPASSKNDTGWWTKNVASIGMFESIWGTPETTADEKISILGPKISLLKLKKASEAEILVIPAENIWTREKSIGEIEMEDIEREKIALRASLENINQEKTIDNNVEKDDKIMEIISIEETKDMIIETKDMIIETKDIIIDSWVSQSIITTNEIDNSTLAVENEIEELQSKEFFPKFQISNNSHHKEDLNDLQDFITIQDHVQGIIPEKDVTYAIGQDLPATAEVSSEENSKESTGEITLIEDIEEDFSDSMTTDPDYVTGVKTELSEKRRGGFRFFIQKKTKIIAWVGLIFSISAVAFFSRWIFPTDLQENGKTNIQEIETIKQEEDTNIMVLTAEDTNTGVVIGEDTNTWVITEVDTIKDITPPLENIGYEIGRDYSITKNTKKNVRTKPVSNSPTENEAITP